MVHVVGVLDGSDALARLNVPEPDGTIVARRNDRLAVGRENDRVGHGAAAPLQGEAQIRGAACLGRWRRFGSHSNRGDEYEGQEASTLHAALRFVSVSEIPGRAPR